MAKPVLVPKVPGEPPGTDTSDLAPLLELALVDLVAGFPALSSLEIDALVALEEAGDARANVLDALSTEQMRRLEDDLPDGMSAPQDPSPEPIELTTPATTGHVTGDPDTYRNQRAADVDQAGLVRPVLTLDGWLLPLPRVQG